jgi:hypothetical protein
VDKPVLLAHHLAGELEGKDVNLALQLRGRTIYYFAKWAVLSKRHRIQCIESPLPNKPLVRIKPVSEAQPAVYQLSGFNT